MSGVGRATRNNPAGGRNPPQQQGPPQQQPPPQQQGQAVPPPDPALVALQQQVQQLQQQLQQAQAQALAQQPVVPPAAPAAAVFALNPAARVTNILDFSDKIHVGLHAKAVASLYGDSDEDKYDLKPENTQTLLNLVFDRSINCNISVLQVPTTMAQVAVANPQTINFCRHHGEISRELITAFANTYLGQDVRLAQDDNILLLLLQNSLTKKAYQTITADRTDFEVNGQSCGLMLFKAILEESSIDTSVDPDLIRIELSMAESKFKDLHFNVREFNEWVKIKVAQLQQRGAESTDIRTHVFSAFLSSNDVDFVNYIKTLKDWVRDNPREPFTYKTLMSRAKDKYESLEQDLLRRQVKTSREDPIVALKAEIKAQNKTIKKIQSQYTKNGGGGGKSNGDKKKQHGKKNSKYVPFPAELKNRAAPDDPSKPLVIDGIEYWYCTKHKKWGKHPTVECKKDESNGSKQDSSKPTGGDRQGRVVRALKAVTG